VWQLPTDGGEIVTVRQQMILGQIPSCRAQPKELFPPCCGCGRMPQSFIPTTNKIGVSMNSGWKTIHRDGPHYFDNGRSLCGFFNQKKEFQPEPEPEHDDACAKCWQLSRQLQPKAPDTVGEVAIAC
jgi:hypothetical protein